MSSILKWPDHCYVEFVVDKGHTGASALASLHQLVAVAFSLRSNRAVQRSRCGFNLLCKFRISIWIHAILTENVSVVSSVLPAEYGLVSLQNPYLLTIHNHISISFVPPKRSQPSILLSSFRTYAAANFYLLTKHFW